MSLQANALITLADLKGFLELSDTTDYDSEGEDLINMLSDLFDSVTHRDLKAKDQTEYRNGDDADVLWLRNWPVNEGTSTVLVYIDMDREFAASTLVATADRIIDVTTGKITLAGTVFPDWPQCVKIFYNAGYSTVPGDLRVAMKVSCKYFRNQKKYAGVTSLSEAGGGASVTLADDLPKSVLTVLARYTRKW